MSYQETRSALGILNHELEARYQADEPIKLSLEGKPKLHIISFRPLVYEAYGIFRNKAPHVSGSLALRAFLSQPHPEGGALIHAGVQVETQGYGFVMDGDSPNSIQAVNDVAESVGIPINLRSTS
jgi:hypothetical protein